jgi:hypothetical protein
MEQAASAISKIDNPTERAAVAMELFGRSGAKMLPLLSQGEEGIAKLRAEIDELGGGITNDFAAASESMNDNLARMNFAIMSLKVRAGNMLLPVISRLAIGFAKTIGQFARYVDKAKEVIGQSNIIKSAFVWLGGIGVAKIFALVGGFKGLGKFIGIAARILARFLVKLALPILLIDELVTTFQGGDTLIRRAIDSMFGEGTTAKIVAWFTGLYDTTTEWLGKVVDFFKTSTTDDIKALFPGVSDDWALMLQSMRDATSLVTGFITDDWGTATSRLSAFWDMLAIAGEIASTEIGAFFVGTAAAIQDAFGAAWNSILDGLKSVMGAIGKVPGLSKLMDSAAAGLDNSRATGGNSDAFDKELRTVRADLATRAEAVDRRMTATNSPTINVTVPPGTPAETARRVGAAAASGTQQGMRASLAAVTRTAG